METITLPDMDRLATFLAVVQYGSFRKAAKARFLSHSTVQKQMRALEHDVGFPLFERSGRSVVLKARGGELAEAAGAAVRACTDLQFQIDRLRSSAPDTVRVTAAPIHMVSRLGVATRHFQQDSDIKIESILRSQDELQDDAAIVNMLRSGTTDVVVTVKELPGCATTELWPLELVAVVPVDFAQAVKRGLSIDSLSGMTIFVQEKAMWSRRQLDRLAMESNVPLKIVTEPLPEVCISLARAGLGVAVVANDNVTSDAPDVLPLLDKNRKRLNDFVRANWLPENDNERLQSFLQYLKDS